MTVTLTMNRTEAEQLLKYVEGSGHEDFERIINCLKTELDAYHEDGYKTVRLGGEFKVFSRDVYGTRRYAGYIPDTGQTAQEAFAAFKAGKGGRV